MAHKLITIDKWYWWMSNDPNIWWIGTFYDWAWVEIRKDSKKVILSPSYNNETLLNSRTNWEIIWSIFYTLSSNVLASKDWSISNAIFTEQLYWRKYVSNLTFYKLFRYQWDTDYWVIIASDWIYRWTITNDTYMWINWTQIVNNPTFSNVWSWNVWSAWIISWWKLTHNPWGFNSPTTQDLTTTVGKRYIINVIAHITWWSCEVKIAWNTIFTITSSNSDIAQSTYHDASLSSETIWFYPTTDFDGYISYCYVEEANITRVITQSFNEQSPILQIGKSLLIWNWNIIDIIDTTTSVWSLSIWLTIERWYIIKWITKIWDQIYVYASNWSDTKQYLWDWITENTPSRSIIWYDKPLQRVISWNNIDYLVVKTSKRSSLWMVNWYQPQMICQSDFILNIDDKFAFDCDYIDSIETIWTKFLLSWQWNYIYSYWNYSPWLPQWIIKEYVYTWWKITNMYYAEDTGYYLFYFYKNWWNNYSAQLYLNDKNSSWALYKDSVIWYITTVSYTHLTLPTKA